MVLDSKRTQALHMPWPMGDSLCTAVPRAPNFRFGACLPQPVELCSDGSTTTAAKTLMKQPAVQCVFECVSNDTLVQTALRFPSRCSCALHKPQTRPGPSVPHGNQPDCQICFKPSIFEGFLAPVYHVGIRVREPGAFPIWQCPAESKSAESPPPYPLSGAPAGDLALE